MTTTNPNNQPTQAFRRGSSAGISYIPTVIDPKTGHHIVLWEDIQDVFENVKSIKNGETHVPLMRDENLTRIMPLRIAYHPEAVLDVIGGSSSPTSHSREATGLTNSIPTSKEPSSHHLSNEPMYNSNTTLLEQDVIELSIANTNSDNHSLVKYSSGMPEESQSSLRAYNQLYNNYFEAIMTGQQMQAETIKQSMDVHFDRLQMEMDKNQALQEQLIKMQQKMEQLQQQTNEKLLEKQDRIIQMQQQALNRLAIIQNRVQALLTQTYELHEYPIPRLFIVLPKVTGFRDRMKKPFADQFRLYFLCECGTHTMPENCKTPHEIHLAKHEGYDLEQPTKFFQQYGTYLLAMMYMIKYGIVAAGLIVPPLANLKVADEIIQRQKHIDSVRDKIAPLVDDTIHYLQGIRHSMGADADLSADHSEFEKLEALEGADLRQLESYLKIQDQGRVLGNLYRIVTHEGHVKWVCFDHYRANYQELVMQRLRDVVDINNGQFTEEIGKIEIKIATHVLAKQFYDALVKARGVQELEITLEWDATMDELRALAKAVTMANVVRLVVDGTHQLKGPAIDIVNRSRRFDPIVQLVSNARLQSLHLKGFDDFFSRASTPLLTPASKFREFSMDSDVPSKDKAIKSFHGFLEQCASLTTVEMKIGSEHRIAKATEDILGKLHNLESLRVGRGNVSYTARVLGSKIQDMSLTTEHLCDLELDDLKFIRQGDLTRLDIQYTPQEADDSRLEDIIRRSPRLCALRIGCAEERCLAVIELVIFTRESLVQGAGLSQLQTFELLEEGLVSFDDYADFTNRTIVQSILTFTEDSSAFDMRTWIRLRTAKSITEDDPICGIVRKYGWSIVRLRIMDPLGDHLLAILDDVTSKRGSMFERIDLHPFLLTDSGLDHLHRIVERSPSSMGLVLSMQRLHMDGRIELAHTLLNQYRRKLHGLFLQGDSPEEWLPQIRSSFPTRSSFPQLALFGVFYREKRINIPSDCIPWVVDMVSAPVLEPELAQQPTPTQDADAIAEESSCNVMSGSRTMAQPGGMELAHLVHISFAFVALLPQEWRMVIEAIDFSTLQKLSLYFSNMMAEQFKLLVDRVPDNTMDRAPLKNLILRGSYVIEKTDSCTLEAMLALLRAKVPLIEITTT